MEITLINNRKNRLSERVPKTKGAHCYTPSTLTYTVTKGDVNFRSLYRMEMKKSFPEPKDFSVNDGVPRTPKKVSVGVPGPQIADISGRNQNLKKPQIGIGHTS